MATSTGFWEDDAGASSTYSLLSGRSPNRYHLTRMLRKRGMREVGEILFTALDENTPSNSASVTISPGGTNSYGGVVTVAAKEFMGSTLDGGASDTAATARNATAADVTTLNKEMIPSGTQSQRKPTETDMIDLSGNGGGGKQD